MSYHGIEGLHKMYCSYPISLSICIEMKRCVSSLSQIYHSCTIFPDDVSSSGANSSHLTITATSVALVILVACGGILCAILVVCLLKRRQSRRGQKQEK